MKRLVSVGIACVLMFGIVAATAFAGEPQRSVSASLNEKQGMIVYETVLAKSQPGKNATALLNELTEFVQTTTGRGIVEAKVVAEEQKQLYTITVSIRYEAENQSVASLIPGVPGVSEIVFASNCDENSRYRVRTIEQLTSWTPDEQAALKTFMTKFSAFNHRLPLDARAKSAAPVGDPKTSFVYEIIWSKEVLQSAITTPAATIASAAK